MKPIHKLPTESLEFHERDACAAVSAMPSNPKAEQYLAEMRACRGEINRREKLQRMRARVHLLCDPLTVPIRKRWAAAPIPWKRGESRDAARAAVYLRATMPRQGKPF